MKYIAINKADYLIASTIRIMNISEIGLKQERKLSHAVSLDVLAAVNENIEADEEFEQRMEESSE